MAQIITSGPIAPAQNFCVLGSMSDETFIGTGTLVWPAHFTLYQAAQVIFPNVSQSLVTVDSGPFSNETQPTATATTDTLLVAGVLGNVTNAVYTIVSVPTITSSANVSEITDSSVPWIQPTSLDYIYDNVTTINRADNTTERLISDAAYDYIIQSKQKINASLILSDGQSGSCVPLPDDPCVNIRAALEDPEITKIIECEEGCDRSNDGNNKDNEDDDDDDDHKIIAGVLGGVGGGIAASTFGAFGWFHRHRLGWKFGEFLFHRSQPMFEFFKSKLAPADIAKFGFKMPPPPSGAPPVFVPPPPPPPPQPPPPPPVDIENGKPENEQEQEQEDPDDGTSSQPPVSPRRDPPVIRLLTKRKSPDCPSRLQKAEAELQAKDREIAQLKEDLKKEQENKKKAEDDLDDCDDELKKLRDAQEQLKKVRSRETAKRLKEANEQLKAKETLVDQLTRQLAETGGDNALTKQQLDQAQSDLKKADEERLASLTAAEAATKEAGEAQQKVDLFIERVECYQRELENARGDTDSSEKQLQKLRDMLQRAEEGQRDANARASEAEGVKAANEAEIARLSSENKEMSQHTCPVSILTQPATCHHTNEEIARMKLNLEACNFDRTKLRRPDPRPELGEEDLPLKDQLERCKRRWHETLAQKASLYNEKEMMDGFARKEISRLKTDLADCRKELGEKKGIEQKPSDQRSSTLDGCQEMLTEAQSDAHECYSQCDCPAGVVEGSGHMRRDLTASHWLAAVAA